jgi:hypothetical protein
VAHELHVKEGADAATDDVTRKHLVAFHIFRTLHGVQAIRPSNATASRQIASNLTTMEPATDATGRSAGASIDAADHPVSPGLRWWHGLRCREEYQAVGDKGLEIGLIAGRQIRS